MITNEQVMKALDAYYGIEHIGGARESLIEKMRKALEAYEASKWVNTEKSLPSKTGNYVTDIGLVHFDSDEKVWCVFNTNGYPDYDVDVAYWQPLPTFKE